LVEELRRLLRENWNKVGDKASVTLVDAATAGAAHGAVQLSLDDEELIRNANELASSWARQRAAELVGRRRLEDGTLIENPDAQWAITESTREKLKEVITGLFESDEGSNLAGVEKKLADAGIISDERASLIARTEISRAQAHGNLVQWKESKLVERVDWQLSADHDHDDVCDEAAANGPYKINEVPDFPAHPNCLCALVVKTLVGEE
jgi:hypothetical protein